MPSIEPLYESTNYKGYYYSIFNGKSIWTDANKTSRFTAEQSVNNNPNKYVILTHDKDSVKFDYIKDKETGRTARIDE